MKVSRRPSAMLIAALYLFSAHMVFCQTEKLDIIEYTPPQGWTKTPKDGLMVYSNSDKNTGGYCRLTDLL